MSAFHGAGSRLEKRIDKVKAQVKDVRDEIKALGGRLDRGLESLSGSTRGASQPQQESILTAPTEQDTAPLRERNR